MRLVGRELRVLRRREEATVVPWIPPPRRDPLRSRAACVKTAFRVRQDCALTISAGAVFAQPSPGDNTLLSKPTSLPTPDSVLPHLQEWFSHVTVTAVATWSGAAAGLALGVVGVYALLAHLGLKTRVTYELIPDSVFDPAPGPVLLTATQLARARRAVSLLPRSASAVRVTLAGDGDGLLRYRLSVPDHARPVLHAALWPGVAPLAPGESPATSAPPRFHPDPDEPGGDSGDSGDGGSSPGPGRRTVLRAELTLARTDRLPLKDRGLDPDPLDAFARAMALVDDGDRVVVHVDLAAVTHARERLWRRRAVADAEREQRGRDEAAEARQKQSGMLGGGSTRLRRVGIVAEEMRVQTRALSGKLFATDPLWQVQVLIRVESVSAERARGHLRVMLAAWEQFAGENYWRVCGVHLGRGWLDGADSWWRRGWFDHRARTGLFAPRRTRRVRTTELLGLLKPPTAKCASTAVARTPALPAAPEDMPLYVSPAKTPGLLPQGFAPVTGGGWRPVGTRAKESLFSLNLGRAEYGKSERAIVQAVHIANVEVPVGLMYLDPHADALERMKPYLGAAADRVLELNLSAGGDTQAGWNPLNMAGRRPAEVEERVSAVVASFASAMGWGNVNNRAQTLTQMAAQSLCELGLRLPSDLQPTIFQMTTILADEDWRAAVLPYLGEHTRSFWETRFAKLSAEAITPVTNMLDRLRASDRVAALFGSPHSTYDVRAAMDAGQIVLACPSGSGDKDKLITALLLYDVLRAALSRRDLPPDRRRPFFLFADEIQQYATRDLARMLEETRKFGLRVAAAAQSVERLPDYLREAFLTNRSHLITTASSADSARVIAREWGSKFPPDQITGLDKYTALASFRLNGKSTEPMFLYGFEVSDTYPDLYDETAPAVIEKAVDVNLRRAPIAETLAGLDTLDERIATALLAGRRPRPAPRPQQQPAGGEATVLNLPAGRRTRPVQQQ